MTLDLALAERNLITILQTEYRAAKKYARKDHRASLLDEPGLQRYPDIQAKIADALDRTFYIRTDSPAVMEVGGKQLVLDLGRGAAAKTLLEENDEDRVFEGFYIIPLPRDYDSALFYTVHALRRLDLAYVPDHHYFVLKGIPGKKLTLEAPSGNQSADFVITENLCYRGRKKPYHVMEVDALRNGCEIRNAEQLLEQAERIVNRLYHYWERYEASHELRRGMHWLHRKSEEHGITGFLVREFLALKPGTPVYAVEPVGHVKMWKSSPREAMMRMLHVQVDPETLQGRLVFSDLEHIAVWDLWEHSFPEMHQRSLLDRVRDLGSHKEDHHNKGLDRK